MFLKMEKNILGYTLVEIMVSIGITGIVAAVVGTLLTNQSRTLKKMQSDTNMQVIARMVERHIADPAVIRNSATLSNISGNIELRNCLKTKGQAQSDGTQCTKTDPEDQETFELVLRLRDLPQNAINLERQTIAGSSASPARYKLLTGEKCDRTNATPDCDIDVRAYFWATCPLETSVYATGVGVPEMTPDSCLSAQTIHVRYQVVYNPTVARSGFRSLSVQNIPRDEFFWNGTDTSPFGAITIPVSSIPGPEAEAIDCPENMTVTSVVEGIPTCECLYPFRDAPGCTTPPCACVHSTNTCDPEERYRGIDANGDPICCQVYCEMRTIRSDGGVRGCGEGGWIESIRPIKPAVTGGVTSTVTGTASGDGGSANAGFDASAIPQASCMSASECSLNKWGGTCNTDVICKEEYKCCYDSGGSLHSQCGTFQTSP